VRATEIKLRAERRAGLLLAEVEVPREPGKRDGGSELAAMLAGEGAERTAMLWQTLAALPGAPLLAVPDWNRRSRRPYDAYGGSRHVAQPAQMGR
jgi:hypothetical protein